MPLISNLMHSFLIKTKESPSGNHQDILTLSRQNKCFPITSRDPCKHKLTYYFNCASTKRLYICLIFNINNPIAILDSQVNILGETSYNYVGEICEPIVPWTFKAINYNWGGDYSLGKHLIYIAPFRFTLESNSSINLLSLVPRKNLIQLQK